MESSNKTLLLLIVCLSSRLVAGTFIPSIAEEPVSSPTLAPSFKSLGLLKKCQGPGGYSLICLGYKEHPYGEDLITSKISAARVYAQSLLEESQKVAKDPSTPSVLAEALTYCRENFESAMENLDEATKGIKTRDVSLLNSMLSAVITDVSTCEDTCSELGTGPSPLSDMQGTLKNKASNCLTVLDHIHW